jgi:CheY-like chemotaxis protein
MFYFNCILLIDDDEIINEVHKEVLRQLYFADKIVAVHSAEAALNYINKFHAETGAFPELILVDINMPLMDGFQFVERLNELPDVDKDTFQISALTSSSDTRDVEMMQKLGVTNYLLKPLNFSKIKEMLAAQ